VGKVESVGSRQQRQFLAGVLLIAGRGLALPSPHAPIASCKTGESDWGT